MAIKSLENITQQLSQCSCSAELQRKALKPFIYGVVEQGGCKIKERLRIHTGASLPPVNPVFHSSPAKKCPNKPSQGKALSHFPLRWKFKAAQVSPAHLKLKKCAEKRPEISSVLKTGLNSPARCSWAWFLQKDRAQCLD